MTHRCCESVLSTQPEARTPARVWGLLGQIWVMTVMAPGERCRVSRCGWDRGPGCGVGIPFVQSSGIQLRGVRIREGAWASCFRFHGSISCQPKAYDLAATTICVGFQRLRSHQQLWHNYPKPHSEKPPTEANTTVSLCTLRVQPYVSEPQNAARQEPHAPRPYATP